MEKTLHIRFYINTKNIVPSHSVQVIPVIYQSNTEVNSLRKGYDDCHLMRWMNEHKNGKVEFVWL